MAIWTLENIYDRTHVKPYSKAKTMSESIRTFLAFDIDNPTVRNKLAKAQALLVQTGADVKLVESENIHVTMRFLGDITPTTVDKVFEEMRKIQFNPFTVQLKGIGRFQALAIPVLSGQESSRAQTNFESSSVRLNPACVRWASRLIRRVSVRI